MNLKGLHIVIIDDAPMTRAVVKQILSNLGTSNVYEAEDGMSGLQLVESCRPDIILCDLSMEPVNGFEFVKFLRGHKSESLRDTPVIILTSHGETEMVNNAAQLRIDGYLLKPIAPKLLADRIQNVMQDLQPAD